MNTIVRNLISFSIAMALGGTSAVIWAVGDAHLSEPGVIIAQPMHD